MKKICIILFISTLFISCSDNKKDVPDVSAIKADLAVQRFDNDFFSIDTVAIEKSVSELQVKYPDFAPVFLQQILGVTSNEGMKAYYRLYKPVYDSSQKVYENFELVKKQVEQALKYVKYYFPSYKIIFHFYFDEINSGTRLAQINFFFP